MFGGLENENLYFSAHAGKNRRRNLGRTGPRHDQMLGVRFWDVPDSSRVPGWRLYTLFRGTESLPVKTKLSFEECLAETLNVSNRNFEASFGEGYWSDHWTYNFDLIENYLKIYPDKETELLLGENKYTYFQSPVKVLPRSEKYVLTKNNTVRQYGALDHNDTSKEKMLGVSKNDTNWLKDKNKKVYKTTLFEKL